MLNSWRVELWSSIVVLTWTTYSYEILVGRSRQILFTETAKP
jgi:hypothetical protein